MSRIFEKELNVRDLPGVIFAYSKMYGGNPDFLYPFTAPLDNDNSSAFQSARDVREKLLKAECTWLCYAGAAGVGQFSLRKRKPAFALGRFNTYFRLPTQDEIEKDIDELEYQVLAYPSIKDVDSWRVISAPGSAANGLKYTGPERILKVAFMTRVLGGEPPVDASPLIREIDEASERGDMIASKGYRLVAARNGIIRYLPFEDQEDYNRDNLIPFERVEIVSAHGKNSVPEEKMLCYLTHHTDNPADLSAAIVKID